VPHNDDAVRACIHLAALPPATTSVVTDVSVVEKWHAEEHGSVGLGVRLALDDLEKLHFVLQLPLGAGIDDPPLDIGKFLWRILHRNTALPGNPSIPLGDVERVLRQQLTEGYQKHLRPDLSMAKLSLNDNEKVPGRRPAEVYYKEISYNGLRGTTVLLKPEPAESDRMHDLVITDCNDCHFYLLQPFEHVTVSFTTGCNIVVGAVAGLLYVLDCEKTQLTSAARRLLIANSSDVLSHVFTPSPPLLVGDNRNCQLAPYNSYYDGLREDLLATGLAAAILNETPPSPTGATFWPLQCASNKWKQPVELAKLELPHVDEDSSKSSTDDAAMQTPILLPASDFQIHFVPFVNENREQPESEEGGDHAESQYCRLLAQALQLSPFQLPTEYERQALVKADRMRTLQNLMKSLTGEQRARLEDELNRGFRDWLVTSGNLRQVLDLVHLEQRCDV
jgi:Tubulin binding cofactor C